MAPIAELDHVPNLEQLGYHENPPPFINALLKTHHQFLIFPDKFGDIINYADERMELLLLDQMNRQIDGTGFVSEFIGRCGTPEEIQAEFDTIADRILTHLHQESSELQDDVTRTLASKEYCSIDALRWLDEQHGTVVKDLKEIRTPEAELFRQRNLDAIRSAQSPKIVYVPIIWPVDRHLIEVKRYTNIPLLPDENRRLLEQLTPIFFNRQKNYPDQDPRTNVGFMQQFRKAGDPVARILANKFEELINLEAYADHVLSLP